MMDSMPDDLLLQFFDDLSFNELMPVLSTSARWRALGSRCRVFWGDIQTPRGYLGAPSHEGTEPADVALAVRRIRCTNGRRFKLRLRSAHPAILAAMADHMADLELLEAYLGDLKAMEAFISLTRTLPAPHLHTLTIEFARRFEPYAILPNDLFTGAVCPELTCLRLTNVILPSMNPLQCFLSVIELCLSHDIDFFSSVTTDIFAHFPSLRSLNLDAPVLTNRLQFTDRQRDIIRRFQTADYSRLPYLGLYRNCWDLAAETGWPLEAVPHLFVDDSKATYFPFLPQTRSNNGHVVFEEQRDERCTIRLGTDDWSFSRGAVSDTWFPEIDSQEALDDMDMAPSIDFQLEGPHVHTVTVPAGIWVRARFVLDDAPSIAILRTIIGAENTLPSMGDFHRLSCPNLRVLILRGGFESVARARVDYTTLVKFASSDLESVEFPISLRLENVELDGVQPEEFTTYFSDVDTQDAKTWKYLNVRDMLNRQYNWL